MKTISNKNFKNLFNKLCCSKCKNDFDIESLKIKEQYENILLCDLICHKCGKDFGTIILNYNDKAKTHSELEIIDGPPPINTDDVINVHKYLKEL